MTHDEVTTLAMNIYKGLVFTSDHIRDPKDITAVFPVILMLNKKDRESLSKDNAAMFYEYKDRSAPGSVNGYPMFFSFHYANGTDRDRVWAKYTEICEAMEKVTTQSSEKTAPQKGSGT